MYFDAEKIPSLIQIVEVIIKVADLPPVIVTRVNLAFKPLQV